MLEKKKKIIIGNWKMKLGQAESVKLAQKMVEFYEADNDKLVVLCPTATALGPVYEVIKNSPMKLGAQNVFYHSEGSYTGEISPAAVKELGAEYVIVGHSERRALGETDDDVNRKVQETLKHDMTPVVCVGETFEEFQQQKTDVVIIQQVTKALEDVHLTEGQRIILAYEPVWVVGRGQAVKHNVVEHIVQIILHTAIDMDPALADKFDAIYGGSVDYKNVGDFIIGNISTGVIVGGNSLDPEAFMRIVGAV